MSELHPLLQVVQTGASPHPLRDTNPRPPWLSPHGWAQLAVWIGERALEPATEYERDILDEAAAIANIVVRRNAIDPAPRGSDERLEVAELARKVVEEVDQKLAQYAQEYGVRLAARALRFVHDRDEFTSALDDEIFRVEAAELVGAHGGPAERVVQALYRNEGKRGRLGMTIVRLVDSYGIVTKLRGRYLWYEGHRADVLATIPDALLSDAVDVIISSEERSTRS